VGGTQWAVLSGQSSVGRCEQAGSGFLRNTIFRRTENHFLSAEACVLKTDNFPPNCHIFAEKLPLAALLTTYLQIIFPVNSHAKRTE